MTNISTDILTDIDESELSNFIRQLYANYSELKSITINIGFGLRGETGYLPYQNRIDVFTASILDDLKSGHFEVRTWGILNTQGFSACEAVAFAILHEVHHVTHESFGPKDFDEATEEILADGFAIVEFNKYVGFFRGKHA